MTKRMLIDATHPEETRVVVVDGNRLDDFDFETAAKKQLKGNIYLARVTRVEPSLQAAFVEYGGNRHGFLAFSEIHPDYYRIPIEDREALLREEQSRGLDEDDEDDDVSEEEVDVQPEEPDGDDAEVEESDAEGSDAEEPDDKETATADAEGETTADSDPVEGDAVVADGAETTASDEDDAPAGEAELAPQAGETDQDRGGSDSEEPQALEADGDEASAGDGDDGAAASDDAEKDESDGEDSGGRAQAADVSVATKKSAKPETVGGDAMEEVRPRRKSANRRYKIQEVVARRQIMLVQVVKEERGNKGTALTTYLSLAGRYCVLMPNTARGGGVSRKITHAGDRKRLKQVVEGLDVPEGMAVIVRTAGSQRTKAEIKRDYEYLLRLWDEIRSTTLDSTAPCLIYEEANLIKRSIRDLYARDIDEVLVDGDDGYRVAKDFIKTLIPSHAKRVKRYKDSHVPLLHRFQVESQLDAIHSPIVELKSGGYIVMNQTEALVAIDVNSGRATSERNIEETALKTNLEAADEVARQLRLRDLAGLVVIDFIDMEESRNQHAVERRMKEAMKSDRARIQIGRISHFGLMELSRQRLRPSLVEASTQVCPHCKGSGYIRSIDSTALHILRVIEEEGLRNRAAEIAVHIPAQVALYILNHKRDRLAEIEARYGTKVFLEPDESLVQPDHRLERLRPKTADERAAFQNAIAAAGPALEEEPEEDDVDDETVDAREDQDERRGRGRSRRRRRGGRRRPEERAAEGVEAEADGEEPEEGVAAAAPDGETDEQDEDEDGRKKRRRGRRGGRRRSRRRRDEQDTADAVAADESAEAGADGEADGEVDAPDEPIAAAAEATAAPEVVTADVAEEASPEETPTPEVVAETTADEAVTAAGEAEEAVKEEKPKRPRRRRKKDAEPAVEAEAVETAEADSPAPAPEPEATPVEPHLEPAEQPAEEAVEEAEADAEPAPEAISDEAGEDQADTGEGDLSEPVPQSASSVPIDVQTLEKPVEKPRKGWWRR